MNLNPLELAQRLHEAASEIEKTHIESLRQSVEARLDASLLEEFEWEIYCPFVSGGGFSFVFLKGTSKSEKAFSFVADFATLHQLSSGMSMPQFEGIIPVCFVDSDEQMRKVAKINFNNHLTVDQLQAFLVASGRLKIKDIDKTIESLREGVQRATEAKKNWEETLKCIEIASFFGVPKNLYLQKEEIETETKGATSEKATTKIPKINDIPWDDIYYTQAVPYPEFVDFHGSWPIVPPSIGETVDIEVNKVNAVRYELVNVNATFTIGRIAPRTAKGADLTVMWQLQRGIPFDSDTWREKPQKVPFHVDFGECFEESLKAVAACVRPTIKFGQTIDIADENSKAMARYKIVSIRGEKVIGKAISIKDTPADIQIDVEGEVVTYQKNLKEENRMQGIDAYRKCEGGKTFSSLIKTADGLFYEQFVYSGKRGDFAFQFCGVEDYDTAVRKNNAPVFDYTRFPSCKVVLAAANYLREE